MWILAICFEVVILVIIGNARGNSNYSVDLEAGELAVGALRTLLLVLMTGCFLVGHNNYHSLRSTSVEREALLGNGHAQAQQKPNSDRHISKDAQSTGWLDYFIGFKKLFPYVWSVRSTPDACQYAD